MQAQECNPEVELWKHSTLFSFQSLDYTRQNFALPYLVQPAVAAFHQTTSNTIKLVAFLQCVLIDWSAHPWRHRCRSRQQQSERACEKSHVLTFATQTLDNMISGRNHKKLTQNQTSNDTKTLSNSNRFRWQHWWSVCSKCFESTASLRFRCHEDAADDEADLATTFNWMKTKCDKTIFDIRHQLMTDSNDYYLHDHNCKYNRHTVKTQADLEGRSISMIEGWDNAPCPPTDRQLQPNAGALLVQSWIRRLHDQTKDTISFHEANACLSSNKLTNLKSLLSWLSQLAASSWLLSLRIALSIHFSACSMMCSTANLILTSEWQSQWLKEKPVQAYLWNIDMHQTWKYMACEPKPTSRQEALKLDALPLVASGSPGWTWSRHPSWDKPITIDVLLNLYNIVWCYSVLFSIKMLY